MSELTNCKYNLTNKFTNWHLTTKNEVDGTAVTTSGAAIGSDSVLTISPCVVGAVIDHVTITGAKGLYVSLAKSAGEGASLSWSATKFEWVIRLIGGSSPPAYEITPHDGRDLYWIDKFGTGAVVTVESGKNVVTPQQYWALTKV